MLKLCRAIKVKVFFLVLVYVFNFDLFEFSVAILEKGLLEIHPMSWWVVHYLRVSSGDKHSKEEDSQQRSTADSENAVRQLKWKQQHTLQLLT